MLFSSFTSAAEPWVDPRLSITEGLQLWLDGTRTQGGKTIQADPHISEWQDGSGHGRHLVQPNKDARPVKLAAGSVAVVRFDGLDDCLRALKQNAKLKEFSVFVVAVPRRNPGMFTGFLAFNAAGQRDYESGLNLDFGPTPTPRFSVLNVEGPGFGGARNLRKIETAFHEPMTLEVSGDAKTVRVAINGKAEGERPRTKDSLSMDEITLGARFYNNGPGNQNAAGFCKCDIAEVLVYDRVLSDDDLTKVRAYLATKYAGLKDAVPPDGDGEMLVPVKNPPPVQVFVPGFEYQALPLDLTNINNIKYREDGTLVALAYSGDIWLLKDTNGDGLEDTATLFYKNEKSLSSPIGMDLTPPNYPLGQGVFVACQGKVVLIVDTDGDGKADKEIIVAGGWKDRSVNIDVVGVTFDKRDGSVWFGRGTANYANAYLIDKDGKAHYSLKDERGTIQRVSPDFKSREVIATGVRFCVGLRFNKQGDLFCSDQEGATWLPNGNPLDELLHIQKGRHYGFPPRHPKHLPDVIDEPSVYDWGPQHQSICGISFNEPVVEGGPTFGPKNWAGDLFAVGYSRGKLYRTKLVKTEAGYVAKNHLFACLNMLSADVCLSPKGDLVVACHSGGPDWGSGPQGKGKLFRIRYAKPELPQPVLVWPAGPNEVRVAFDKPVDPEQFRNALKDVKLTAGKYVRAGDRFESLWPGYAVVQAEKASPRYDVPVHSLALTPDRRTLVLSTGSITAALHYALTLPGPVDLDFDLSGVEISKENQKIWLPSLNTYAGWEFAKGSVEHESFWPTGMIHKGTATFRTKLNLDHLLQPAVQPGSRLDYEQTRENITLGVSALFGPAKLKPLDGMTIASQEDRSNLSFHRYFKGVPSKPSQVDFEATVPMGVQIGGNLSVQYSVDGAERFRILPPHRSVVPWAVARTSNESQALPPPPELAGGSWARGRKVFFSDEAACAKCHTIHARGETIGPDLSNLIHRDYASVLRDIAQPSFALNPDHLTYIVTLNDGRSFTGVTQTVGNKLRIGDVKGNIVEVAVADVESRKPSSLSTMPEGLPKLLGPERMKDLLTYLLTSPVSMPRAGTTPLPRPRTIAEVNAALAGSAKLEKLKPLRLVLVAGPKDHGPGEHDYPAWQTAWAELLGAADGVEIVKAWEWPSKEEFAKADALVIFQHGDWNAARAADVDAFLERGGGLTFIHWAVDGRKDAPGFAKRIGLAGNGGAVGYRHGDLTLEMNGKLKHPILRNFDKLKLTDETYWKMTGELKPDSVLATAVEENAPQPQLWTLEHGSGRVFVSIPGHYSHTFDDPLFRILLLRGILWSANEPVDRFNELAWPGAHVAR